MNNDNKILNQTPPPVAQGDQAQPQITIQPVQPSASVGSVNKEVETIGASVSEFIKPTDAEPQIDKNLTELGIEAKKENPNLTEEHKKLGVDHAGPHIPVPSFASSKVTLPMSEDEIMDKLKTGQDDDSGKWLAGLLQKIMKALGL